MSTWSCAQCTAVYSVGAPRCPQCGATEHQEDGMPKSHADGPPTPAEPAPARRKRTRGGTDTEKSS